MPLTHEIHIHMSSAGNQSYQMAPGRTQTSALPNLAHKEALKDMQLYKQLVCENESYAVKLRGLHQVTMKRNIINNDNKDRGNTFVRDVTVCLCDNRAWER